MWRWFVQARSRWQFPIEHTFTKGGLPSVPFPRYSGSNLYIRFSLNVVFIRGECRTARKIIWVTAAIWLEGRDEKG